MSGAQKITRERALKTADLLVALLSPHCQRVEIAGSLRRGKFEVGDIELVAMPKLVEVGLWGDLGLDIQFFSKAMAGQSIVAKKNGQFYKQFEFEGTPVDLFIATPEKWGCVYLIRTGSADFVHRMVTPRRHGGWCPSNFRFQDGRLWEGQDLLDTPEEEDVFLALGRKFVEPSLRN